jgi:excisionase family DNA binding protein
MNTTPVPDSAPVANDQMSTMEVARLLGLAVRSIQLMVDRGELEAWKTPGGHRRISRSSVERWRNGVRGTPRLVDAGNSPPSPARRQGDIKPPGARTDHPRVLLIEDSMHFQNLISLIVRQHFPAVELRSANDGIAGLAMAGAFQPDVLMVDILLPGIDGATLITSLRSHPQFRQVQVIVVTSLGLEELAPYAFALEGVPVIHKPRLVAELPALLGQCLDRRQNESLEVA